jgi:ATP-dependent RNA helicase DDX51/DBP6
VDHLRYTKGFTLKYLEWLVIDEADRLLNESFQEWVDVVIGSLDARHAPETFGPGGKLLSELGLPIETKPPRKVVLSATMTRDITKLNSLRLDDPKMVIIGAENAMDPEDPSARNSDAHFTLPSTLRERMVAVGDEALKPLYLLRLLLSHIGVEVDKKSSLASKASDSDSTSSDDTSSDDETTSDESSDDDDTSSSGSDSESDSDASSDTSSSDSSDSESESESESESKPEIVSKLGPRATTVLIFTKSSESASRLSRLISLLHPQLASRVGTIIKSDKSSASRKTLAAYRKGKISVIVATDRASRGLDLQSLSHVINYDVPSSITTYVHRVGRTARAGKEGSAWSLVAHREGRWFANEIAASMDGPITRNSPIDRVQVKTNDLKSLQEKYPKALEKLEQEVKVSRARPSKSKP